MSEKPVTTAPHTEATEHVHGPDCNHDHHHDHEPINPYRRDMPKIGRNDPCHCGSGKKYKKCHGESLQG